MFDREEIFLRYPVLSSCREDLARALRILKNTVGSGGMILACGNGGSAADSGHIVGELMKGFLKKRPLSPEEKARFAPFGEEGAALANALQNGVCIDIPPAGIDKGEGVARYADSMGVPPDNVYCAGDNMNDCAMIARFHGLAVENAVPALKSAAEATLPDIAAMIGFIMERETR